MAIHFSVEELAERRRQVCERLKRDGLDGLLMFRQESMYYLSGYDSFGYAFFQCCVLDADGGLFLLTRAPDLRQAQRTSVIEAIHIWTDREGNDPTLDLRARLREHGLAGKRLGVEWDAHGLTALNGQRLAQAMDGFCALADASHLVSGFRLVKSPAEIACLRQAATLADAAYDAALETCAADADEATILAAMQGAVLAGGGDYPGNEFIIGSGPDALLCRYKSGRRRLSAQDQLTLEWAGAWRHYHAAMMRTFVIGTATADMRAMHGAARDALLACEENLRPGACMGDVFAAHAKVLDKAGLRAHRMNACGYAMGACFPPCWMDWPMFYEGNPVELTPGMAFFIHIIIFDSGRGLAQTLGRSSLIGEKGAESLSQRPLDLVVV